MALTSLLPNNYRKNNSEYLYKIPLNTPINFFLNFDETETYANFNDLIISTFDGLNNEVTSDVVALSKVDLGGGEYRIYVEDLMLTNEQPNDIYYFKVYDTNTGYVLYLLNCFKVIDPVDSGDYARVQYRHSTNIDNFNYEELPNYYNIMYVDLNLTDIQGEYEFEPYNERTTGYMRKYKTQSKDIVTLTGSKFDDRANSAMRSISMHDDIEINFRPYEVKEGWKTEPNIRTSRIDGKIVLVDQLTAERNLNG